MTTGTEKLPESVDLIVLDASGELRDNVGLGELAGYLSDGDALVWCDVYSNDGGQSGPYGRLLSETFGFAPSRSRTDSPRVTCPRSTTTASASSWSRSPSASPAASTG